MMANNSMLKSRRKLSKHIVIIVSILMVGGLIIAYLLKYEGSGNEPQQAVAEQKQAAMIAAQIGNDTPESESNARADIAERDQKIKAKIAVQAKADQLNTVKYPDMPLANGVVTQHQIDHYQAIKDAINLNYTTLKQGLFKADALPASFDAGAETDTASAGQDSKGSSANPAATSEQLAAASSAAQQIKAADESANAQSQRALASQQAAQSHARRDPNELWQEKQVQTSTVAQSRRLLPDLPPSTSLLQEGSVLQLVLLTAIDNTLPGHVSARVTENVYDSISGAQLIIPAGSKLEGDYNQSTVFGQDRMMFGFKRIILPTGASIRISAWNGTDALGRSGVKGNVNNHLLPQLSTGIFLAVLARALTPANTSGNLILNTGAGSGAVSDAAGQVTVDTATGILSKYQNLKPQLTIAAGSKISLIVLEDIEMPDLSEIKGGAN